MKRFLILLIVIMLLFTCSAENIDLDSMTMQELIELDFQIRKKIAETDFSSEGILYSGIYTIGVDLEEGQYLFKCVDSNEAGFVSRVKLVNPEEHSVVDDAFMSPGEVHYFNAVNELQIRIDSGAVLYIKK